MKTAIFLLVLLAGLPSVAPAKSHPRSREVTKQFQREHPCHGKKYGACPGYIKDHITALCDGGSDTVSNLQWQTKEAAKAKDKTECRQRRR